MTILEDDGAAVAVEFECVENGEVLLVVALAPLSRLRCLGASRLSDFAETFWTFACATIMPYLMSVCSANLIAAACIGCCSSRCVADGFAPVFFVSNESINFSPLPDPASFHVHGSSYFSFSAMRQRGSWNCSLVEHTFELDAL